MDEIENDETMEYRKTELRQLNSRCVDQSADVSFKDEDGKIYKAKLTALGTKKKESIGKRNPQSEVEVIYRLVEIDTNRTWYFGEDSLRKRLKTPDFESLPS